MALVFSPVRERLALAGYVSVAHIHYFLWDDLTYAEEPSRFLREMALGEWHPQNRSADPVAGTAAQAENSVDTLANALVNFLTYLEVHRRDWRTVSYQDLLDRYQKHMRSGEWSTLRDDNNRRLGLQPSTINQRVDAATNFLLWAADRGLRGNFRIPLERSRVPESARRIERPQGGSRVKVRQNPQQLTLPSVVELGEWIEDVLLKHGPTKALACRSIVETGMRLEETASFRAWQVPDPDDLDPDMPASMQIFYGTKGQREIGDVELKGKSRTLRFEHSFLVILHDYKRLLRAKITANRPADVPKSDIFFLANDGSPLGKQAIYRAFTDSDRLPYKGWSPHAGRHAFACMILLRLIDEDARRNATLPERMPRGALMLQTEGLIKTYIRPLLGHVSDRTTERYLQWIANQIYLPDFRLSYSRYLAGERSWPT
jgi:site-specific recombinase XerD